MILTHVLVPLLILAYILHRWLDFRRAVSSINNLPGFRTLLHTEFPFPATMFTALQVSKAWMTSQKYAPFAKAGREALSVVSIFPNASVLFQIADPSTIKEITSSRARFPKALWLFDSVAFYGPNIISTEGDEWKRHRKPIAPAFSERNSRFVWEEAVNNMLELFETPAWKTQSCVEMDHCLDLTLPIALLVLAVAGFGKKVSWEQDGEVPHGHAMSFKEALHIASTNLIPRLVLPDWALGLRSEWRRVRTGFEELHAYMQEMIHDRQNGIEKQERFDLLSGLVDEGNTLSNDDIISNIFIFLVAGHETTAHTLAFALGLLALYQDEQEKLFQQIKTHMPDDHIPTYDEMSKFPYSIAVLNETLRMFTPANKVEKLCAEDTTLTVTCARADGTYGQEALFAPRGSMLALSIIAVHYNPRFWQDPHVFRPERFMKADWPRDAFLPFSSGVHACIGRKFFETSATAALTILVSKYKIEVKDKPEWVGMSVEEKAVHLLRYRPVLTNTPYQIPLRFVRR